MGLADASNSSAVSSDFTLLEGLYQLAVTGNTDAWEFERLNDAVYERLLSSYGKIEARNPMVSQNLID
ncbi:MAG TPA: hypothetical protein VEY92_01085 [Pseudoxanthomonas sp.]|nr:hypothetical protein [Pseudoxanthomonas sp.]